MLKHRSFTHVGGRGYTGHYAVTTDAYRTPGVIHALNPVPGRFAYKSLCGVTVAEQSDDHYIDQNPVRVCTDPASVRCNRCRRALGLRWWWIEYRNPGQIRWIKRNEEYPTETMASEAMVERKAKYPRTEYRVRGVEGGTQ